MSTSPAPERVLVSCSAFHGEAPDRPRRLPDRHDRGELVGAYLVASPEQAEQVFRELDHPGRTIHVDVERKQPFDLMAVALATVRHSPIETTKPNDATVNALEACLLDRFGPDLSHLRVGVVGTGNLAFKIALRLSERSCEVFVAGRNPANVRRTVEAISAILPRYEPHRPREWADERVDALVSAVTASAYVGPQWLERCREGGLAIDIGIDNFAPEFIAGTHDAGIECRRLDVRAAPTQVTSVRDNDFFRTTIGRARVGDIVVVSGGLIGARGELVVDQARRPERVIGVANGTGGLLPPHDWSPEEAERHRLLTARLAAGTIHAETA